MDDILHANTFTGAQSVDEYVRVSDAVAGRLELYRSFRRDPVEYSQTADGLFRYVQTILRPFPYAIELCLPSSVFDVSELPEGHADFLRVSIIEYISQAVHE
ncbi:hypothetical protein DFH09DRAFT_1332351 [Mycena vulgaris]|nr:hypothetical protein DFH09DRAFT_1332351 [Mycena vulgaris]